MNLLSATRIAIAFSYIAFLTVSVSLIVACGATNSGAPKDRQVKSDAASASDPEIPPQTVQGESGADTMSQNIPAAASDDEMQNTTSPDTEQASVASKMSDTAKTEKASVTASTDLLLPTLNNAGAKRCILSDPKVVGTSDKRITNPDYWVYDVTYGVNGGLVVWPDGEVVRTRPVSADGVPQEGTHTVEMAGLRNIELFTAGDFFLLITQSTCQPEMPLSPGRLTPPSDNSPRNHAMKTFAAMGWNCISMRLLDRSGNAIGPVSTYPGYRPLGGLVVKQLASDMLVFCGEYYHSGPQCTHLKIGADNRISASHVYNMNLNWQPVLDVIYPALENGSEQWLLLSEDDEDGGLTMVWYRGADIRKKSRILAPSLYVNDLAATDNALLVVSGPTPPGIRGFLYNLTRLSPETGKRIGKDKKIKKGQPIPPPFNSRLYVDYECQNGARKCTLRRNNLLWEPIGDPVRLPEAATFNTGFSGRVFTVVYPAKTGPKEWTLQLTNVDCRPSLETMQRRSES